MRLLAHVAVSQAMRDTNTMWVTTRNLRLKDFLGAGRDPTPDGQSLDAEVNQS